VGPRRGIAKDEDGEDKKCTEKRNNKTKTRTKTKKPQFAASGVEEGWQLKVEGWKLKNVSRRCSMFQVFRRLTAGCHVRITGFVSSALINLRRQR
jgi:hypothetical protein